MALTEPSSPTSELMAAELGRVYSLNLVFYNEIGLPSVRVGQCIAFVYREKLDVVELTDTVIHAVRC